MNKTTAPKYFADLDDSTDTWCVFSTKSDRAYASFSSKAEAVAYAKKMNEDRKA
jgi:hypothetical protein